MHVEISRPFPTVALPRVWRWIEVIRDRVADDYFPKTLDGFVDDWLLMNDRVDRFTWGVRRDGVLGGVITSARVSPTVRDFHVIMQKDFWGRGTTQPAIEAALIEVFKPVDEGGCGARKLSTLMFAGNFSTASLLKTFGVKREGLLHGHTLQGGKPVDLAILGLQREAFYVIRDQRRNAEQQQHNGSTCTADVSASDQHQPERIDTDQPKRDDERQHVGGLGHQQDPIAGTGADKSDSVQDNSAVGNQPGIVDGSSTEPGAQPS